MLLSKSGEYGVQVVLHLAAGGAGAPVPVHELARRCGIPQPFLGKICLRLTRAGILSAQRGPGGGVTLARAPWRITVLDIVRAMDGPQGFDRCVLGLDPCDHGQPCPLHEGWHDIKEQTLRMLSSRNLERLVADLAAGRTTLDKLAASVRR